MLRTALESDTGLSAVPGGDLVSGIPPEVFGRLEAGPESA